MEQTQNPTMGATIKNDNKHNANPHLAKAKCNVWQMLKSISYWKTQIKLNLCKTATLKKTEYCFPRPIIA